MSGHTAFFLVQASSPVDACTVASEAIDDLFDWGWLCEGDRGYVDALECPKADGSPDLDGHVLHAGADPEAFITELQNLEALRLKQARGLIREAHDEMFKGGIGSLLWAELEEQNPKMGMVGYRLKRAGQIIGRDFTPVMVLWNVVDTEAGVSSEDLEAIRADPALWYLVEVTIG